MKNSRKLFLSFVLSIISLSAFADKNLTTKFIANPSFEKGTQGWDISNLKTQTNSSFTEKKGTT